MSDKGLLYIGNRLSERSGTVTTIDVLGKLLQDEGYTVYMASSKKNKLLRLIDMLYTTLKYSQRVSLVLIDTYSTTNFYYAVAVSNLCRMLNLPYIPILHGGNLPNRLKNTKNLSYKLFNGAHINVAPSKYLIAQFQAEGYTNLIHIPNSIEIANYPFKPRHQVSARLLWVRSFAEIYNPMLAISIVEMLQNMGIATELCMVGPDKDGTMDACKHVVATKELPVKFTGKVTKAEWIELSKHYDIFINTTNFDNTPVSVIEAMALGFPVVSTNVGGMPYLLEDGIDGILVKPNNVIAFCEAIKKLIQDESRTVAIATQARQKVESFDWNIIKHRWFRLLDA